MLFGCLDSAEARGAGDEGDVARDESPADGVGERAADDEVDLVDGLGGEPGRAVGGVEERFVECFEMLGAESAESDPAERRKDVEQMPADQLRVLQGDLRRKKRPRHPAGDVHRVQAQMAREVGDEGERAVRELRLDVEPGGEQRLDPARGQARSR
ncbi:MAG: hypothetical protein ACRDZ3_01860, partial [Acidimicrobiia bacterium]